MKTRRTRISDRKAGNAAYQATWQGKRAVHTTFEGERIIGVIDWPVGQQYPIIRMADGRWARQTNALEMVVEA